MRKIIFYIVTLAGILTFSCSSKNGKSKNLTKTENKIGHYELTFPNKILKNALIGKLKYYYELSDTVKTDKDDIRIMTVYAKLSENKIDPKYLDKVECQIKYYLAFSLSEILNTLCHNLLK